MPAASILIKPASSNCNLDCKYCFYKVLSSNREEYSKGFMKEETLEALVREGIAYADGSLTFAFQGGEPTLAGLPFFKRVLELQKQYNTKHLTIENTLQTNGMVIDDAWAQFFAEHDFLVGISLDGPKKLHDKYRVDYQNRESFEQVMHAISLFRKYGVQFNILTVVTEALAQQASYVYKFYKRHAFPYVQLIPCMDEKKRCCMVEEGSGAVTPESYGRFLCEFFDLWYEDFQRGEEMDVRIFSNLAQMAAGYPAEECGMNGCCNCYFVVEGDGSVYPCDFYCMDEWKLGEAGHPFIEMIQSERARAFVADSRTQCEDCKECPYLSLCHGGCRRWREETKGMYGRNRLCAAYQMFFAHTWDRLQRLGDVITRAYGRKFLIDR